MEDNIKVLDDNILFEDAPISATTPSKIGKAAAIATFLFGTIILILDLTRIVKFMPYEVDSIGPWAVPLFLVILLNFLLVLFLSFAGKSSEEKSVNRKMAGKMMLNVLVAFVYHSIIFVNS